MTKGKKKFYCYFLIDQNISSITTSWEECKKITSGTRSRYKSFPTLEEAETWIKEGCIYQPNPIEAQKKKEKKISNLSLKSSLEEGIYFDAGTGRKIGVEVRVTNLQGTSYLNKFFPAKVNEFGNINLGMEATNNYGELLGLYCALKIALRKQIPKIFGDSNLVLEFWSKNRANKTNLPEATVRLIHLVSSLRKEFESFGGTVHYVSGDINPADLGFHK